MQIYPGMGYHEIGRLPYEAFLELMEVANIVNAEDEQQATEPDVRNVQNSPQAVNDFAKFARIKL
jgi:hypothetical protein